MCWYCESFCVPNIDARDTRSVQFKLGIGYFTRYIRDIELDIDYLTAVTVSWSLMSDHSHLLFCQILCFQIVYFFTNCSFCFDLFLFWFSFQCMLWADCKSFSFNWLNAPLEIDLFIKMAWGRLINALFIVPKSLDLTIVNISIIDGKANESCISEGRKNGIAWKNKSELNINSIRSGSNWLEFCAKLS